MGRKYIDCRDYPGDVKCSVALSADSTDELLETVVHHGTTVHGYEETTMRTYLLKDIVKRGEWFPPAVKRINR